MTVLTGKKAEKTITCPRCMGKGRLDWAVHVMNGVCFLCRGARRVAISFYDAPAMDGEGTVLYGDGTSAGFMFGSIVLDVRRNTFIPAGTDSLGHPYPASHYRTDCLVRIKKHLDLVRAGGDWAMNAALYAAGCVAAFNGLAGGEKVRVRALAYVAGADLAGFFERAVQDLEGRAEEAVKRNTWERATRSVDMELASEFDESDYADR